MSISYQYRSERGDELGEVNIKIMIDDHHFGKSKMDADSLLKFMNFVVTRNGKSDLYP